MFQTKLQYRVAKLLTVLLLAGFVGACTGEGGGDSGPTAPGAKAVSEIEYQIFEVTNSERQSRGITPILKYRGKLSDVARAHSKSMRENDFFSHTGMDGDNLVNRLQAAGIDFSNAGENIVKFTAGGDPAVMAHDILMGSSSHRSNILSDRFNRMGVGISRRGNEYWVTQVYIKP